MGEREQLREALAEAVRDHLLERLAYQGEYGTTTHEQHIFDAETDFAHELNDGHLVDAVLAVLDQQGRVSPEQWKKDQAAAFLTGMDAANVDAAEIERLEAERDAALRDNERMQELLAKSSGRRTLDLIQQVADWMRVCHQQESEIERLEAALREAARYEPVGFATVPRDLHTHSARHQERWTDHGCVPLYRQVTEGEEG